MENKLQEFYKFLKKTKGLSDRTIYFYLNYHRHFRKQQLTQGNISRYIQRNNNNSVCRGYIKAYLEFLKKDKEFELPKTKSGSSKRRMMRELTKREIKKIREMAYNTNTRDGILFDILYWGALRRAEVLSIKTNSFLWDRWFENPKHFCELKVIGKRNKERKVLVHPKAVKEILRLYYQKGVLTPYMKPNDILDKLNSMEDDLFKRMTEIKVWRIVKKYSNKALNRDIRTHDIRKNRATEMAENGVPLKDIQKYLGHSGLTTTEIYLFSNEEKSLQRIKDFTTKEDQEK